MTATSRLRWFRVTPDRLVPALLVAECLLWLSGRFRWFGFNAHKGWTVLIAVACVGVFLLAMLLWLVIAWLFRRQFQLGLRSLLILTVAVALPFSWLAVEMKTARERRPLLRQFHKLKDDDWALAEDSPTELGWLSKLLGDEFFEEVVADDSHFRIEYFSLACTEVTDVGLEDLERFTALKGLDLSKTSITDAGLESLKGLSGLEQLYLAETAITDAGLDKLKGLTALEWLDLHGTRVTDEGVKKLHRALPECKIDVGRAAP